MAADAIDFLVYLEIRFIPLTLTFTGRYYGTEHCTGLSKCIILPFSLVEKPENSVQLLFHKYNLVFFLPWGR